MNFKQASRIGLRFNTTKGQLTVEQLWHLSLTELDTLAVRLEKECESAKSKSFLDVKKESDKETKLAFDIVLDILETKVAEKELALNAKKTKDFNQKIDNLIAEKQEEGLKGKSIEELEAMRIKA